MPFNELISVILPTYNRAHLIERAINSILGQTYPNIELVVIDDASSDNTKELINGIRDDRVKYIAHSERRGANAARNTGILAAKGKYIAFQDSDDEWINTKLETQIKVLEDEPEISVIFSSHLRYTKNRYQLIPKPSRKIKYGLTNFKRELLYGNFITTQTLLVEKKALFQIGLFDETLQRFQDWDIAIRLSRFSPFFYIEEPLVRVYLSDDSITNTPDTLIKATEAILEKYYASDFNNDLTALALQYLNLGLCSLKAGKPLPFFTYIVKSLKLDGIIPLNLFLASFILFKRVIHSNFPLSK